MNWFLDGTNWLDNSSGVPTLTWNAEAGRYEILVSDPVYGGAQLHLINETSPTEDGEIDFIYLIGDYESQGGYLDAFIVVLDATTNEVLHSVEIATAATGRVSIPTEAGKFYEIMLSYSATGYDVGNFYSIEATLTPQADVQPPWWMCVPKVMEPCPVRPTAFVPFAEYNVNFKFPTASSRVPSKIARAEGCSPCSPTMIDAEETPPVVNPPVCAVLSLVSGSGDNTNIQTADFSNLPVWFEPGSPFSILYYPEDFATNYTTTSGGWVQVSGAINYGPALGTGTLSQGANEVCITWSILSGS